VEAIVDAAGAEPFIKVPVMGARIVVVTSPAAADAAVHRNKWVPKYAPVYEALFFLGTRAHAMISVTPEAEHKRLRHEFTRFFASENVEAVVSRLAGEVDKACVALAARTRDVATGGDGSVALDARAFADDIINAVVLKARSSSARLARFA
jgi:cytochrome P450